nr:NAD(P)-dependent oxidoreductase [Actinokineospora baliensis]
MVPKVGIAVFGCEPDEGVVFRELAPRYGAVLAVTEAAVSEGNARLAAGRRCVSVGHKARVGEGVLRALGEAGVRYLSTRSVGYDHIDVGCAERLGIVVGNAAYSPDSVADYTVMLMLMAVRHAKATIRRVDLHDYRLNPLRGKELRDLTVGVLGVGQIGGAVVARLRGFGGRVVAWDRSRARAVEQVELDELLRLSDIVTLHLPLGADTHHLLSGDRIARMKPGAYLINTGRGSLVDTEALLLALESGVLGGAALDVVEGEEGIFYADRRGGPVGNDALVRLQRLPNVVISPHTAYYTDHALRDVVGNSLMNCVNFEVGERNG